MAKKDLQESDILDCVHSFKLWCQDYKSKMTYDEFVRLESRLRILDEDIIEAFK